jgi:hypothetical protein
MLPLRFILFVPSFNKVFNVKSGETFIWLGSLERNDGLSRWTGVSLSGLLAVLSCPPLRAMRRDQWHSWTDPGPAYSVVCSMQTRSDRALQAKQCDPQLMLLRAHTLHSTAVTRHTTYFNTKQLCILPTMYSCVLYDFDIKQRIYKQNSVCVFCFTILRHRNFSVKNKRWDVSPKWRSSNLRQESRLFWLSCFMAFLSPCG